MGENENRRNAKEISESEIVKLLYERALHDHAFLVPVLPCPNNSRVTTIPSQNSIWFSWLVHWTSLWCL